MRQKIIGILKKAVVASGIIAFVAAGYLAMSVATSCTADAQCTCATPMCLTPGSFMTGYGAVAVATGTNVASVIAVLTVSFEKELAAQRDAIRQQIDTTEKDIVGAIDTLWYYNLKPALQNMTKQLNARDIDQTRQLAAFQDAMNVNRINLQMMEKQLESHRDQRVSESACVAATLTGSMNRATTILKAYAAAAAAEAFPRSSNSTASKSFSGKDGVDLAGSSLIKPAYAASVSPAALGSAADLADRWQHYKTNYCDHRANGKNAGCTSSAPYRNKDLDVTGEIFAKPTLDFKEAGPGGQKLHKMFTDDIVTNLAEPFVTDNIPPKVLDLTEGKEEMLDRRSYQAKRQTIYDLLYGTIARRTPSSNGGASTNFLGEVREAAGVDTVRISDNPSYNEVMQTMMSERFHTGAVSVDQVDDPENNAKEMVIQQAMQAMQQYDMIELLDRWALILAAQTGNNIVGTRPFDNSTRNSDTRGGNGQ